MASPVRTCVGCRRTAVKADLVRLVWRGAVVVDARAVEPGRGAYLHPGPVCLEAALRKRSLIRALRSGALDPDQARRAFGGQVT